MGAEAGGAGVQGPLGWDTCVKTATLTTTRVLGTRTQTSFLTETLQQEHIPRLCLRKAYSDSVKLSYV